MIYVFGPRDKAPAGLPVINTTSGSSDWGRAFSPFFLGPCDLYGDHIAQKMENAWQFSKVYEAHTKDGEPTEDYWKWARLGWVSHRAFRYPMGRGAVPLYSLWDGKKLNYVEARKAIYIPLFATAVRRHAPEAYKRLQAMYQEGGTFGLWDYDGYDHHKIGMTLEQVREDPKRKMGHAFVLAMMLEGLA